MPSEPARANGVHRLLAIDPSSTRTGWAVFEGSGPGGVLSRPRLAGCGALGPFRGVADERIDRMCVALLELLVRWLPAVAVIEVPSGRQGAGTKAGAKGQLAIYGLAVGELRRLLKDWDGRCAGAYLPRLDVCSVDERTWTRCRPKRVRKVLAARAWPDYLQVADHDAGGDIADAILIGDWWLRVRPTSAAPSAESKKAGK